MEPKLQVMLDTNVLFSIIYYPSLNIAELIDKITDGYYLVLSQEVIDELFDVAKRKSLNISRVHDFLRDTPYMLERRTGRTIQATFRIRDAKDYPILCAAIMSNVDIFITGDRDFEDVHPEKPVILGPREFLDKY